MQQGQYVDLAASVEIRDTDSRKGHQKGAGTNNPFMTDLVELQNSKLDLLVLVLLLLGLGVCLLLTLLGSTKQTHKNVHGGLVRDTLRGQRSLGLKLTSTEHHPLLSSRDAYICNPC